MLSDWTIFDFKASDKAELDSVFTDFSSVDEATVDCVLNVLKLIFVSEVVDVTSAEGFCFPVATGVPVTVEVASKLEMEETELAAVETTELVTAVTEGANVLGCFISDFICCSAFTSDNLLFISLDIFK